MKNQDIWTEVQAELREDKAVLPYWPQQIVSQASRVGEFPADMLKVANAVKYSGKPEEEGEKELRKLAVRTIARAIRFIDALKPKDGMLTIEASTDVQDRETSENLKPEDHDGN